MNESVLVVPGAVRGEIPIVIVCLGGAVYTRGGGEFWINFVPEVDISVFLRDFGEPEAIEKRSEGCWLFCHVWLNLNILCGLRLGEREQGCRDEEDSEGEDGEGFEDGNQKNEITIRITLFSIV